MAVGIRIQKGKLLKQYIGEVLFPLGFTYEGRQGDTWVFERRVEKLRQTIAFYEYRFDRNMLSFDLYTNAIGSGMAQAIDIEGIEFNSYMPGFWTYTDKDDFIGLLIKIREILVTKGMQVLEEHSIPAKGCPTDEMNHELYCNHAKLAASFIERTKVEVTGFDQENIDRWFDVIQQQTNELSKREFEDVQPELVEIAAFLGEMLVKYKGAEWEDDIVEEHETCMVINVKAKRDTSINPLSILCGGYSLNNDMMWVKDSYEMFID